MSARLSPTAQDQRLARTTLLASVVPMGYVNVVALIFAPLVFVHTASDRLDRGDLRLWVVGIWFGAVLQGIILGVRNVSRWWQRSPASWEACYAGVEVIVGILWSLGLIIEVVNGDPFAVQMLLVAFLMMTTAAGVVAFAGSRLIGRGFILGQWLSFVVIVSYRDETELILAAGMTCAVSLVYLQLTNCLLSESVNARLRSSELSEELMVQANTDALTGLRNRSAILEALDSLLEAGHRPTVMFVDLDGFKEVNDVYGHAKGDEVIVEVSRRLEDAVRRNDMVGRLGGDEFVVVLVDALGVEQAEVRARRMIADVARPVGTSPSVAVTASIGIAVAEATDAAGRLLGRADLAMYAVKNSGGDSLISFEKSLEEHRVDQVSLRRDLRVAIHGGEIAAHAQPLVRLLDGSIIGWELLARWQRSSGQAVPPTEFVPLAESLGLDAELGRVMLDHAAWGSATAGVRVWVNVSVRHLIQGELVTDLLDAAQRHNVSPATLGIEITESQMIGDFDRAALEIRRLASIGVEVAIDDFGTGNSSLAAIDQLPVSRLKLAPEFGLRSIRSERSTVIIQQMVMLAPHFGFDVLAEGIETQEIAATLQGLGIELGQGYHFGRPRSWRAIVAEHGPADSRR